MASGSVLISSPIAMQSCMRSVRVDSIGDVGRSASSISLPATCSHPLGRRSIVTPVSATRDELRTALNSRKAFIMGSSSLNSRVLEPFSRQIRQVGFSRRRPNCRSSLAEGKAAVGSNAGRSDSPVSDGHSWTSRGSLQSGGFLATPIFEEETTAAFRQGALGDAPVFEEATNGVSHADISGGGGSLGELHADNFERMEALISERDVLGGDHEAFVMEAIARDSVHFLAPQGKRRHLPLFVFLPGLDGTGLYCKQQLPGLVEEFDIRCLSIPNGDTSSIAELADAAAALIRHERVARERLVEGGDVSEGRDVSEARVSEERMFAGELSSASVRSAGEVGSLTNGLHSDGVSNGALSPPVWDSSPASDPSPNPPQTPPQTTPSNPSLKTPYPMTVYAESFGTGIALRLASCYPTEVHTLIILNSVTAFRRQPLLKFSSMFLGSVPAGLHDLGSYAIAPLLADWRRLSEDSRYLLLPPFSTRVLTPPAVTLRTQMMLSFDPSEADLNRIQASTLLLASGRDRLMPSVEEADWLANRIPDCRIKVLPDSGHIALLEDGICLTTLLREAGILGAQNGTLSEGSESILSGGSESTALTDLDLASGNGVDSTNGRLKDMELTSGDGVDSTNGIRTGELDRGEKEAGVEDGGEGPVAAVGPGTGPRKSKPENENDAKGDPREMPGPEENSSDFSDALKGKDPNRKLGDDLAGQLRKATEKVSEGLDKRADEKESDGAGTSNSLGSDGRPSNGLDSEGGRSDGRELERSSSDRVGNGGGVSDPVGKVGSRGIEFGSTQQKGSALNGSLNGHSIGSSKGLPEDRLAALPQSAGVQLAELAQKNAKGRKRTVPIEEVNRRRKSRQPHADSGASMPIMEKDLRWLSDVGNRLLANLLGLGRETGGIGAVAGLQEFDGRLETTNDGFGRSLDEEDAESSEAIGRSSMEPRGRLSGSGGVGVAGFLDKLVEKPEGVTLGSSRAEGAVAGKRNTATAGNADSTFVNVRSGLVEREGITGVQVQGSGENGRASSNGRASTKSLSLSSGLRQAGAEVSRDGKGDVSIVSGSGRGDVSGNGAAEKKLPLVGRTNIGERNGAERNGTEVLAGARNENGARGKSGTAGAAREGSLNGVGNSQNGRTLLQGDGTVGGAAAIVENGNGDGNGKATGRVGVLSSETSAEESPSAVAVTTSSVGKEGTADSIEKGGVRIGEGAEEAAPPAAKKGPEDLKLGGVAAGHAFDALLDDMPQYRLWNWLTRPEFYGMDDIPVDAAPLLFVGNHTLFGIYDMPLMMYELRKRRGLVLRGLAHEWHWKSPLGDIFEKYGAVKATPRNCFNLLKAGEPVLLYPGGGREVAKRKGEKYKLLWKDDTDFVRLAMKCKATIIPFATVGVEDAFDILMGPDEIMDSPLGELIRPALKATGFNEDVIPSLATGGNLLPRPERLYFNFGEPIYTSHYTRKDLKDKEECARLYQQAKKAVEDGILLLQAKRSKDPLRELFPRTMVNIMEGWDGS